MEQHAHPRPRLLWAISFNASAFLILTVTIVIRIIVLIVLSKGMMYDLESKLIATIVMDSIYIAIVVPATIRRNSNLLMLSVIVMILCLAASLPVNEDRYEDQAFFWALVLVQVSAAAFNLWLAIILKNLHYDLQRLTRLQLMGEEPTLYDSMRV